MFCRVGLPESLPRRVLERIDQGVKSVLRARESHPEVAVDVDRFGNAVGATGWTRSVFEVVVALHAAPSVDAVSVACQPFARVDSCEAVSNLKRIGFG